MNKPESTVRTTGSRHDDTLKIRLPSELKDELRDAAAADEDTESMTEWVIREVRAGLKIRELDNET